MREEWESLVDISLRILQDKDTIESVATALASSAGAGVESIKRKILGIQYVHSLGRDELELKGMGQEKVLSLYGKAKKAEKYEKPVKLIFDISGSQREVVQKTLEHVKQVCGFTNSEQLWDFLNAELTQTTDEQLRHAAGLIKHSDPAAHPPTDRP